MRKTFPDPLLIAHIEPYQGGLSGDFYYRTYLPGRALAQDPRIRFLGLSNLHPWRWHAMHEADILVLKNLCDVDLLPVIAARKGKGQVTVLEIADDLTALQAWNPVHAFYQNADNILLLQLIARSCDGVQFTTDPLREKFGCLNANQITLPNHISLADFSTDMSRGDGLRIGWGGSHGHLEDIARIAPAISAWVRRCENVRLCLMCSESIRELFPELTAASRLIRDTPPGSIHAYYAFLAGLDIGIAPLQDTPYNRARSDVKFLEYGASCTAPVLAARTPYLHSAIPFSTALLYDTPGELVQCLDLLRQDVRLRRRIASHANAYVREHRQQECNYASRLAFYERLLRTAARKEMRSEPHKKNGDLSFLRRWFEENGCRFACPTADAFERKMADGVLALESGRRQSAVDSLQAAADLAPQDYLPWLALATAQDTSAPAVDNALRANPASIRAWLLRGETAARNGRAGAALESYERAAALCPAYHLPYAKTAELLARLGEHRQASALGEKAACLRRQLESTAGCDLDNGVPLREQGGRRESETVAAPGGARSRD